MYSKIMVPVDLAHTERLGKALETAAALARAFHAPVCYVGATTTTPGPLAHSPAEFAGKLEAFVRGQAEAHGIEAEAKTVIAHDPSIDLDDVLQRALQETGADLVVMATHLPDVTDFIWAGHGDSMATHATVSVLLVR